MRPLPCTSTEEVPEHEGSSVREADLRKVQDHQAQGQGHGHLREPQAQAEAGLRRFRQNHLSEIQQNLDG